MTKGVIKAVSTGVDTVSNLFDDNCTEKVKLLLFFFSVWDIFH